MTIADIETPILGWDVITAFQLDIIWSNGKWCLYSAKSKSQYPLQTGKIAPGHLNLAPVDTQSFAKYSQSRKTPHTELRLNLAG